MIGVMTTSQALWLGLIQGATEFLPISSTGHLMLFESFYGIPLDPRSMQGFNIVLHAGTLLALLLMYVRTWKRLLCALVSPDTEGRKLILLLILATIPAGVVGIVFVEAIANANAPTLTALGFLLTAVFLLLAERAKQRGTMAHLSPMHALLIGCAQAVALLPSVSRSGLAYGGARLLGISRQDSLDFSFLIALPAIAGATLFTAWDVRVGNVIFPSSDILVAGFLSSLLSSILAILVLRLLVRRMALSWFAIYLIPLSLILLGRFS